MAEKVRVKGKEREAIPGAIYEALYSSREDFVERQKMGQIVVKDTDREDELCRQGWAKWFLHPQVFTDTALQDWYVFYHDIKKESGKHRHQGGLILFIIEGKGATEVDGEMIDWEEGDMVLLPVKPGGCEHKHYNHEPGKGAKWLAFIYLPMWDHVASELAQVEVFSEFKERYGA